MYGLFSGVFSHRSRILDRFLFGVGDKEGERRRRGGFSTVWEGTQQGGRWPRGCARVAREEEVGGGGGGRCVCVCVCARKGDREGNPPSNGTNVFVVFFVFLFRQALAPPVTMVMTRRLWREGRRSVSLCFPFKVEIEAVLKRGWGTMVRDVSKEETNKTETQGHATALQNTRKLTNTRKNKQTKNRQPACLLLIALLSFFPLHCSC